MNITPTLGWSILALAIIGAGAVLAAVQSWAGDRWEFTCGRPWIARRWYGTRSQVVMRSHADDDDPDRYVVLAWDSENSAAPWLKVHKLNPEFITYWDEDAEPFWAPVTDFAPYAVRRFRPGVKFTGGVPVAWLAEYPPLPYSVRVPEDVRHAA